jgi:hypothetical protein
MENFVERTLTSFLLSVLAFAGTAHAQRAERVIKANIPFEFSVGDQTFPAGNYLLVSAAPAQLELRDAENRSLTKMLTDPVQTLETPASPKLLFYSEGGQQALARVWQEDYSIGQELRLPKSWTKSARRHVSHALTVVEVNSQ